MASKQGKTPVQPKTPVKTLTKSKNSIVAKTNKLKKQSSLKKVNAANDSSLLKNVAVANNVQNNQQNKPQPVNQGVVAAKKTYISEKLELKKKLNQLDAKAKQQLYLETEKKEINRQLEVLKQASEFLADEIKIGSQNGNKTPDSWEKELEGLNALASELTDRDKKIDEQLKDIDNVESVNKKDEDDFNNDVNTKKTLENNTYLLRSTLDILSSVYTNVADVNHNFKDNDKSMKTRLSRIQKLQKDLNDASNELLAFSAEKLKSLDDNNKAIELKKREDELLTLLKVDENKNSKRLFWPTKPSVFNTVNDVKKWQDSEIKRETLLTELSYLRSLKDDWVNQAGGLDKVTQTELDAFNKKKGLAIDNVNELQQMYKSLPIGDYFVANYKQTNNNDAFWNDIENSLKKKYTTKGGTKDDKIKDIGAELDANDIILTSFSHGGETSSHLLKRFVDQASDPGVIYIEAPYAFNLLDQPHKAVGAWILGTGVGFPDTTYEALQHAVDKKWKVVPVDATQIGSGALDYELLRASNVPKSTTASPASTAGANVPRQNYIARNIHANLNGTHQTKRGAIVNIGNLHIGPKIGGNLDKMLAKGYEQKRSFDKDHKALTVKRDTLNPKVDYKAVVPPPKLIPFQVKAIKKAIRNKDMKTLNSYVVKYQTDIETLAKVVGKEALARKKKLIK